MEIRLGTDEQGNTVLINDQQFRRHMYMAGLSGTGKSTTTASVFLQTIASQDPRYGAILFDPIGDLVRNVRRRIPEDRRDDVIVIDPLDREWPVALNPFAGNADDQDADLVLAQLMAMYQLLFEDRLDPQVEGVLRGVTMTQLVARSSDGAFYPAFDEVPPMLVLETAGDTSKPWFKRNPTTYRAAAAYEYLKESGLSYIWEAYDRLTPNPQARLANTVISKFDRFLGIPIIRNMVCQPSSIDFGKVVDEGKIVLVNLAEQTLGEASNFLANIIMAKVLAAVYGQRTLEVEHRPRFAIFADEFYRYATEPFMELFRKGRNFGATVVVGHTDRGSLWPWQRPALENAQNVLCFNLSAVDAYELARIFDSTPPEADPEYRPIYEGFTPTALDAKFHRLAGDPPTAKDIESLVLYARSVREAVSNLQATQYDLAIQGSNSRFVKDMVESLILIADDKSDYARNGYWSDFIDEAQDYPAIVAWAQSYESWRGDMLRNHIDTGVNVDTSWDGTATREWMTTHLPPREIGELADAVHESYQGFLNAPDAVFARKVAWIRKYESLSLKEFGDVKDGVQTDRYTRILNRQEGPALHRRVPGRQRPYSDVYQEIANDLCHQPDYQARVKLSGQTNRPIELIIRTLPLGRENDEYEKDEKFFEQRTHDIYCRHVSEVEQLLKEREAARRRIIEGAERAGLAIEEAGHTFEQHPDGLSN